MDIIFKSKQMEEIICYWIEIMYITKMIDNLVEYTDEVGEHYERVDWFLDDPTGKGNTVMDIHINLERTSSMSTKLLFDVEVKLQTVIIAMVESGKGIFKSYQGKNISSQIENIMTCLYENFDDIYDYGKNEQIENFYKVLKRCLDKSDDI